MWCVGAFSGGYEFCIEFYIHNRGSATMVITTYVCSVIQGYKQ